MANFYQILFYVSVLFLGCDLQPSKLEVGDCVTEPNEYLSNPGKIFVLYKIVAINDSSVYVILKSGNDESMEGKVWKTWNQPYPVSKPISKKLFKIICPENW